MHKPDYIITNKKMNQSTDNEHAHSGKSSFFLGLLALVFGLAFGAVGFFGGLKPLYQMATTYANAQSFVAVEGKVLDARVLSVRGSKGASMSQLRVRYQYKYQDSPYEGNTVGLLDEGADNIDDWHRRWGERLQRSQQTNRPIVVWVNPSNPSQALLDRHIRWPMVLSLLPFAIVFSLVGLLAWALLWSILRGKPFISFKSKKLQRSQRLALDERSEIQATSSAGIWVFAIFWCGLSWPIAALIWTGSHPVLAKVVITILAFIGLFLMFIAIKGKRIDAATKRIKISLVPAHPTLGNPLLVKLSFTPELIASAAANTELALICYATDRQSSSSSPREIWAQRITTSVRPELNRMRLEHTFDIPKDLPVSGHDSSRSDDIRWVVELLNLNHGKRLSWVVQVRAPSSMSPQMLSSVSQQHSNIGSNAFDAIDMSAQSKLRDLSNLQQWLEQPDTVEPLIQLPTKVFKAITTETGSMLVFPRRGWRMASLLLIALAAWLSYLARHEFTYSGIASTLWGLCCMLASLMITVLALHWGSLKWVITTQTNGLVIDRSSWLRKRVYSLKCAALQRVQLKYMYAQNDGTGLIKNFNLRVQLSLEKNGWITLTPAIAHEAIAKQTMAHIWNMQRDAHTRFSVPVNTQTLSMAHTPRSLVLVCIFAMAVGIFAFASSGMVSRKMWPSSFIAIDSIQRAWQMRLREFLPTGRLNQRLFDAQSNSDI